MTEFTRGMPKEPGWYLFEAARDAGGYASFFVAEVVTYQEEGREYPTWTLMKGNGGNHFHGDNAYVDEGQVLGYISITNDMGVALIQRMYLNMLRQAWGFDRWWTQTGDMQQWETAVAYLDKCVNIAGNEMELHVNRDIPKEVQKVQHTQFTKLLSLLIPGERDAEARAILPLTLTVRETNNVGDNNDSPVLDLLFVNGILEATRAREQNSYSRLRHEFKIGETTLEDISKWTERDTTGIHPKTCHQVLIKGEWEGWVSLGDLQGEFNGPEDEE